MATNDDKVIRAAKILSMLWTSSVDPMGQEFLDAVNDVHLTVCELYGVDPKVGFQMKTTHDPIPAQDTGDGG